MAARRSSRLFFAWKLFCYGLGTATAAFVAVQLWFFATPIIYPVAMVTRARGVGADLFGYVLNANPMTWFVSLFRESIYGTVVENPDPRGTTDFITLAQNWPSLELLVGCTLAAFVTFTVGYLAFHRFALNFAKEV